MDGCELAALKDAEHERVEVVRDREGDLLAVIAVHSTALGPAMGGVRWAPYDSLSDAVADALRLSAAMTVKSSLAGLALGGGKSVIVGSAESAECRLRSLDAFATELERLNGLYVAAEDIGTGAADMDRLAESTEWVVGRSPRLGGSGDPSPVTARTVLAAIEHAHALLDGTVDLDELRVGVLGVGKVGGRLAEMLADRGARVLLADADSERAAAVAEAIGASVIAVEELPFEQLDVLCPCARGGVIDEASVGRLRSRIVCGAANNMLADDMLAARLAAAGILYVPDFVANAGGIIQVGGEFLGWSAAEIEGAIERSVGICGEILEESLRGDRTALSIAMARALARVRAAEEARSLGRHRDIEGEPVRTHARQAV